MPFKSFTMDQYQLIKFVMKQKLQPFFFLEQIHSTNHCTTGSIDADCICNKTCIFHIIGLPQIHGRRKQNKCGWVLHQKKKLLEYMPFSVVWCLLINGIGHLIGSCYLHYLCPLTSQHYKRRLFKHNSSGAACKGVVFLKQATRVRVCLLPKSFFSLFTSHITSERHLLSIKNKNEGNNRKV